MSNYHSLPTPPENFSAGSILARFIDSIGFRYQMASNGLTENEISFCPVEGSMNMTELNQHIYQVLAWAHRAFDKDAVRRKDLESFDDYRTAILQCCAEFKGRLLIMSDEEIESVGVYLRRADANYSFWYLINGPLTDVLTHIGQMVSWRRIAGNPVARISPFTGEKY